MSENKIKVICFCSKSGVGKSTIIESFRNNNKFNEVVSNSTRLPRDEFDKTTHHFKAMIDYKTDLKNDDVVASYHSPKGYVNWADYSCFDENKINLWAIDIFASLRLLNNPRFDIKIVYLTCNEVTRIERLLKRGSEVGDYKIEPHLELDLIDYAKHKNCISIIDTTDKSVESIKDEIINFTELDLDNFEVIEVNNSIIIQFLDKKDLILENKVYESNLEKILDYILQEYTYIGFTRLNTHTEIYIEYKGKNYTYYDLTLDNATILDYNRLIETLLKWKCGVCYDRDYK